MQRKDDSKPRGNGGSVLRTGGRHLRTQEELNAANEQIFDAIEHGRCSPKQMEQMNTVIKSQVKLNFEFPFRMLQLLRDLRKAGVDIKGKESTGTKLLKANPSLQAMLGDVEDVA